MSEAALVFNLAGAIGGAVTAARTPGAGILANGGTLFAVRTPGISILSCGAESDAETPGEGILVNDARAGILRGKALCSITEWLSPRHIMAVIRTPNRVTVPQEGCPGRFA